jgi:hypothetical protein
VNQELEALLKAFDSLMEAQTSEEAQRCRGVYERKLQDVLAENPALSRASLHNAIVKRFPEWARKQNKPPALPPKA